MKGIAICLKGIERVTEEEIIELTGAEPEVSETALMFNIKNMEGLARFCYRAQSVVKVLLFLGMATVSDTLPETLTSLEKSIKKMKLDTWLKGRTFRVRCKRIGEHKYSGQDIAAKAGEYIIDRTGAKVSMTAPDVIIYVYIYGKSCYIGIDISGFDLSKRDYKVFTHPTSLNPTIAYSLVRIAGFKKGVMADPFCGSGTIPIEAALYVTGRSAHFFKKDKFAFYTLGKISMDSFDKLKEPDTRITASDYILKNVKSTKNNAKLAGVDKAIHVTRMDIEWLDTKYDKDSLDLIITHPPSVSRLHDESHIRRLFKEFFHQAEFVLNDRGRIVMCLQKDDVMKECMSGFEMAETFSVWQGSLELKVAVLKKKKI